jgi:hypothetical protein
MDARKRKAEPLPSEPRKRSRYEEDASKAEGATVASNVRPSGAAPSLTVTAAPAPAEVAGISQSVLEAAQKAARMRAAALAAQSGSSLPSSGVKDKKTVLPPPLVLDAAGKAVEDILKMPVQRVTTLKINDPHRIAPPKSATISAGIPDAHSNVPSGPATEGAAYNPYLAHRLAKPPAPLPESLPGAPSATTAQGESGDLVLTKTVQTEEAAAPAKPSQVVEYALQLPDPARARARRAKKGLQFFEEGSLIHLADEMREAAAQRAQMAAYRARGTRMRPALHNDLEDADPAGVEGGVQGGVQGGVEGAEPSADPTPSAASALTLDVPVKHRGFILGKSQSTATNLAGKIETMQPTMEWWDTAFLPPARQQEYTEYMQARKARVTARPEDANADQSAQDVAFGYEECNLPNQQAWEYVQHPVPIQSSVDEELMSKPIVVPLKLTKDEQKRLRRTERASRNKELLDKQRMGLLPPPEPKVRLANLMRVLTDAAVADPSAVEAKVREQMAQRVKNHEMRNLAKKLTPEERRDKWKTKMTAHGPHGPDCVLLRVPTLVNKRIRAKIDLTAKDTFLTGIVLECRNSGFSLVVVEGGTRATKKYLRLMTHRIDWNKAVLPANKEDELDDDNDEDAEGDDEVTREVHGITAKGVGSGAGSKCEVLWQGTVSKRNFEDFRFEATKSASAARKLLAGKSLAHMWDMVAHSARLAGITGMNGDAGDAERLSDGHVVFSGQSGIFQQPESALQPVNNT